ncbi:MAG TPA: hypothetical protein VGG19_19450 [Tepidisphaeraceae bacterium]|jgi:hypothetical protein
MFKAVLMSLLLAAVAGGETVHLSDGTTVQGNIYRDGAGWKLVMPNGNTRELAADDVVSIDMTSSNGGDDLGDQLSSLRHSLSYSDSPSQAVGRLQNFIQHNAGTPAAKEAEKDLAIWKDRDARALQKVGDDWLTPDQAEKLRAEAILLADQARQLIRKGDIAGAQKLLDQIVAVDPRSVAGVYLHGVLAFGNNAFLQAEKDFLAVSQMVPQHGPTLNNLAMLSFHSGHFAQSAQRYVQALRSDTMNQKIIDNVAEMLHALPEDLLTLPEVRMLQQEFARQESAFEQIMAKQNLSRWGAKWITSDQLKQIQEAQKIIQDKLTQLRDEQTKEKESINNLDEQISTNQQQEQQIASTSYVTANGRVVYTGLPQSYYDLQRDDLDLKTRRDSALRRLDQIAVEIRTTKTQVPIQPFTGVQLIFGEEGTPVTAPKQAAMDSATTEPAALAAP